MTVGDEQGLFVGGPKHGQVLSTHGQPHTVVALDYRGGDRPYDQVHYRRLRMTFAMADGSGTFLREFWYSGAGTPDQEYVADALLRAWFRDGQRL